MRKRAVFGRIGRQFMEDESQRRCRFFADRTPASDDPDSLAVDPAIWGQKFGQQPVQRIFGPPGMGADEIVRLAQRADRVRQFPDKSSAPGCLRPCSDISPLITAKMFLIRCESSRASRSRDRTALQIVDIDGGTEPGLGILVSDDEGPGAQDHPAIDTVVSLQARLGLPAFLLARETVRAVLQLFDVVGMNQRGGIEIGEIVDAQKFVKRGIGVFDLASAFAARA